MHHRRFSQNSRIFLRSRMENSNIVLKCLEPALRKSSESSSMICVIRWKWWESLPSNLDWSKLNKFQTWDKNYLSDFWVQVIATFGYLSLRDTLLVLVQACSCKHCFVSKGNDNCSWLTQKNHHCRRGQRRLLFLREGQATRCNHQPIRTLFSDLPRNILWT